eukprot:CAMPEP_0174896880 /NCGR_PEP_ID=MMETSP0167-20121228/10968_1 /TAXON_ID=38298 /ORGANISM="Rhodella maculata, Strain CCMP736" /LENGTH=113 /DNA_ID=CAMNT_0016136553 /DNA_START=1023 /DNA_END=1364 /DNA_ORIENTATION=-
MGNPNYPVSTGPVVAAMQVLNNSHSMAANTQQTPNDPPELFITIPACDNDLHFTQSVAPARIADSDRERMYAENMQGAHSGGAWTSRPRHGDLAGADGSRIPAASSSGWLRGA